MTSRSSFYNLVLSAALILPLAACATAQGPGQNARMNSALNEAAQEASATGDVQQSLPLLERAYKHDPNNAASALKYATALQDAGRTQRALLILNPFIDSGKADKNSALLAEFASIHAANGEYDVAVANARKAVAADPKNGMAYHVLGIALDAQGNHPDAEDAFRRALANWQGDPSPVLNNLGLNLASQGFIDEAVDTLKKATELAPQRAEIQRNLRIVVALQNQPGTHENKRVPPPPRKPQAGGKPVMHSIRAESRKAVDDADQDDASDQYGDPEDNTNQ